MARVLVLGASGQMGSRVIRLKREVHGVEAIGASGHLQRIAGEL